MTTGSDRLIRKTEDRKRKLSETIDALRDQRQDLILAHNIIGRKATNNIAPEEMQEFLNILVNYLATGHFTVYQRILDGTERRAIVKEVARKSYPGIGETTDVFVEFNDVYENFDGAAVDYKHLKKDLTELGEIIARRVFLEDELFDALLNTESGKIDPPARNRNTIQENLSTTVCSNYLLENLLAKANCRMQTDNVITHPVQITSNTISGTTIEHIENFLLHLENQPIEVPFINTRSDGNHKNIEIYCVFLASGAVRTFVGNVVKKPQSLSVYPGYLDLVDPDNEVATCNDGLINDFKINCIIFGVPYE